MHYTLQFEAIVTHIVSQVAYRWLPLPITQFSMTPLPLFETHGISDRYDPLQISLRDWHEYIRVQKESVGASAWVETCNRLNLSSIGLATLIFDNLQHIQRAGAQLIDYYHPLYPYLLKHIPDPPACLTCVGDLALLNQPKLGIVGSRKASDFAYQESRALALGLAKRGAVVVSGGAVGCDAAAHLGALESALLPIPTIIVQAGGLHRYYPECLSSLFARLREGRALFVSERLWEYPSRPMDFPVRNRIIAGMSQSLALMQAAAKSGALKTAAYALEQGREVYTLVHESDDIRAEGSRQLLEDGALPFQSHHDLLSLHAAF